MIPVHALIPDLLARIVRKAPLSPEKIAFAWRAAVGASIERVTTVDLDGKVLRVRAENAAWKREVKRSAPLIRKRLDDLLGPDVVRSLQVWSDDPQDTRARPRRRAR